MKNFDYIAAKSCHDDKTKWLSFKVHSLDTAGVIRYLYDKWLPENIKIYLLKHLNLTCDYDKADQFNRNFCQLLALLHDIGKLTPAFQYKIAKHIEGYTEMLSDQMLDVSYIAEFKETPHALAGQVILEENHFPQEISIIIGSHHGKSQPVSHDVQLSNFGSNYFGYQRKQEQNWRSLWNEWIAYVFNETGFCIDTLPKPDVKVQMLLTGLLIMADWISSNVYYFPYDEKNQDERIHSALKKLSLPGRWEANFNYDDLQKFFNERFAYKANIVQNTVMNTVLKNCQPGIYILEAPMGIGKTEAALAAAEILAAKFNAGGVYFGLPTQATANGLFQRFHEWTKQLSENETHALRLAHGMIELNEKYKAMFHGTAADSGDENIIVHEWFEGRKQALLSEFVVATVDQFLLASLKQKHVMLRHLGLSGKIVIIDECHAYDAYMNVYLDNTLRWLGAYEVPVIILSATLPPQRRNELIKAYLNRLKFPEIRHPCDEMVYPVLTWTSGKEIQQEAISIDTPDKHISVIRITEINLAGHLSEMLSDGGCAAVIVNTVKQAQNISRELFEALPEFEIICFHSRFIASDRAKIENMILQKVGKESDSKERNKCIVVGTQVLEQSLDIDFDYMITELCPMDLLLQRSGRLHRHKEHDAIRPEKLKSAKLAILPSSENTPYDKWILQQTETFIPDAFIIPSCIPYLVSKVYAEPQNKEKLYQEYHDNIKTKEGKARKYCIEATKLKSKRITLNDLLNSDVGNSTQAEASVRDAKETIEVIVVKKVSENQYSLVSENILFDITQTPSKEEALKIAKQRLRLPSYFSDDFYTVENILKNNMPTHWLFSEWLKNELLLVLDENSKTELIGKILEYNQNYGLEVLNSQHNYQKSES